MIGDVDIGGVFVPTLMALMILTYGVHMLLRSVLARVGFYRLVWHRALFDLAIYILLLGGIVSVFIHTLT